MPDEQDRIQIAFLGETFTVKGDSSREEIKKTSDYLQEQLDFLKVRYPSLTAKNLAILTAFTLADELLRTRRDYEAIVSILDKA
ncbi:MAG: cell division protein ZapA [Clostridiales bacterium]|nr:cell division protein ZapA [Clostridiales bacterium]